MVYGPNPGVQLVLKKNQGSQDPAATAAETSWNLSARVDAAKLPKTSHLQST